MNCIIIIDLLSYGSLIISDYIPYLSITYVCQVLVHMNTDRVRFLLRKHAFGCAIHSLCPQLIAIQHVAHPLSYIYCSSILIRITLYFFLLNGFVTCCCALNYYMLYCTLSSYTGVQVNELIYSSRST